MTRGRVEAFSDGVLAIVITIMVLEMKVPHGADWAAVLPLWPVFLSYILSFAHIGIYWNNHHHMFHAVKRVDGSVLWANLHLLFWLSLMPFVTGWMGENHFAPLPVALYGGVLIMAAVAYFILVHTLLRLHGGDTAFAKAIGSDFKGKVSVVIYAAAIPLAFVTEWLALAFYVAVAVMWFIPDRRFERVLMER
ncbi:TMEM175 family protein [Chelativorans xinjiangense]|uniref:TMEM175 family protein n=1 Tax=Chelativorans xinjiangense TaxID=2681485 RepID=UPI0013597A60|nr:TMEM175 family protein [Chelativorans xinjiangense]